MHENLIKERRCLIVLLASALLPVSALLVSPSAFAEEKDHGLRNASHPAPGLLFGGQPTEGQLEAMAADGLALVLDLRSEGEDRGFDESAALERLSVSYENIPVDGDRLEEAETFERFFAAMDRAGDGPVLVHCASGNRVGALYYAWLVAEKGVDRGEALEHAQANGLRSSSLEKAVDRYLDSNP